MTIFRPCIDLHNGKVKQIVGSTLSSKTEVNFETDKSPVWYANLYKKDRLTGGHIIMLGGENSSVAKAALESYPNALQIGGGITLDNAEEYINAGASHVIITSLLFPNGKFDLSDLILLSSKIGKEHIVIDLSCNSDRNILLKYWKDKSNIILTPELLNILSHYCDEFLIHACDVEGKQNGMDIELIKFLSEYSPIKTTYAGGARDISDLYLVNEISNGKIDLTIGSALDIFGGKLKYTDCVKFNVEINT